MGMVQSEPLHTQQISGHDFERRPEIKPVLSGGPASNGSVLAPIGEGQESGSAADSRS